MNNKLCPCKSNKLYKDCCKKYHLFKSFPSNALELMRSRFSAYALGLEDYIIKTSHRKNPCFKKDLKTLRKEIKEFSKNTKFENLEILEFKENENEAFVTFKAYLKTDHIDTSFIEISYFEKIKGIWFYKDGKIIS